MSLKKTWALLLSLVMIISLLPSNYVNATEIVSPNKASGISIDDTFSDNEFRSLLKTSSYDKNADGYLDKSEILDITSLSLDATTQGINSIDGISELYAIKTLSLNGDIDVDDCTHIAQLETLSIKNNSVASSLNLIGYYDSYTKKYGIENLKSLTISNCSNITSFYMNSITEISLLDISGMPNLTYLNIGCTGINDLVLPNNHKITYISLNDISKLKKIDLKSNSSLSNLSIYQCNDIESINLKNSSSLNNVNFNSLPKLEEIDLPLNNKLNEVHINSTSVSAVDFANCSSLEILELNYCPISSLDISSNTKLKTLIVNNTSLTSLNWTNNSKLEKIDISNTYITNNDFSMLGNLTDLNCINCNFTELILDENQDNIVNINNSDNLNLGCSRDKYLKCIKQSDGSYIVNISSLIPNYATKFSSSKYTAQYYPNGKNYAVDAVSCQINSSGVVLPASFVDSSYPEKSVRIRQQIGTNRQGKALTFDLFILVSKTEVNDSVIDFNETNFPDDNFREFIRNNNYDAIENDSLRIDKVKRLYIDDSSTSANNINLKGIELLTELTSLNITGCNVANLNLKNCNKLENVYISNTNIDSIEIGNPQSLTYLTLTNNNLTSINTSKMISLNYLSLRNNKLTALDLRNNNKLQYVSASNNCIIDVKVPSNPVNEVTYDLSSQIYNVNVTKANDGYYYANNELLAKYAPGSDEISVPFEYENMIKAAYWTKNGWKWTDNPLEGEYSRLLYLYIPITKKNNICVSVTLINAFETVEDKVIVINENNFPDANFRKIISSYISSDGKLHSKEVTSINLTSIDNLKGLELLTELRRIYFYDCSQKSIDLSKNTKLVRIIVNSCGFTSLDLRKHKSIKEIRCYDFLWQLLVPEGKEIVLAYYPSNVPRFTATKGSDGKYRLTIPRDSQLNNGNLFNASETFENGAFVWNKLSDIPITLTYDYLISGAYSEDDDYNENQILVNHLQITNNSPADPVDKIIEVNSSNFPDEGFRKYLKDTYGNTVSSNKVVSLNLYDFDEYYIDDLTGIQLFTNLRSLSVFTPVKKIDLSKNVNLCSLVINNASLTKIDVSNCKYLEYLDLRYNALTSIDLTNCKNIRTLIIFDNALTKINVSGLLNLRVLDISNNSLTKVDVSKNILLNELNVAANALSTIDLKKNTNLISLNVRSNQLSSIDLSAQKTKLKCFEINDNHGKLKKIDLCGFTKLNTLDINDIEVCMDYKNVPYGRSFCLGSCIQGGPCKLSNKSLTLSGANRLRFVNLNDVSVSSINLKDCRRMQYLYMNNTGIKSLDVSKCIYLMELEAMGNSISSISFKDLDSLKVIRLSNNKLSKIDVTMLPALKDLWLSDNNISSIDVTKNPALKYLYIAKNPITYLDLSNNEAMLEYTDISGMSLPALNTSKNKILSSVDSYGSQNVKANSVDVEKKSGKYIITFDKLGKGIEKSKIKNVKGAKLTDKGFEVNKSGGKFASFTYSYNLSNSYHLQNSSMSVNVKFTDPGINKSSVTLYFLGSSKWEKENSSEKLVFENVSKKAKIKWSSSNKKVVSVSSKGVITPIKVGKATITAVYNNKKYTCKVTVKNPVIKLKTTSVTVKKGKTVSIKYSIAPKDKGIWYTDNKIAKITQIEDGVIKIKGLKKGTTTISISIGATSKKIKVKVK